MENSDKEKYKNKDYDHQYNRRSLNHDYTKPATYHIILKKNPDIPYFGHPAGNVDKAPDERGSIFISHSLLGKIINDDIFNWTKRFPFLKIYQHIVMPDHVHILVRVIEDIPHKFGYYVNKMKVNIAFRWNEANGRIMPSVFEENFTDKIIYPNRSLKEIITYIKHNPYRLGIRKAYPHFFKRIRNIEIAGEEWEAYGNIFLIRNPFKEVVIVHRIDSDKDKQDLLNLCLENGKNGGVAVSAFIAPGEKTIRDALKKAGRRIIHVREKPFGERFKPGDDFDYCKEGNLLILAPKFPLPEERERERCLHRNRIAEAVASDNFTLGFSL